MIGAFTQPKQPQFSGTLSDYVTAIAWSADGTTMSASSSAGEVVLWEVTGAIATLQNPDGNSVDCLAFSKDGKLLATGGQNGQVKIWRVDSGKGELIAILENAPAWIDHLDWSPTRNQLAFSTGRQVKVWDADNPHRQRGGVVATLNFAASSVLDMVWHPVEEYVAIAGYKGVKIWNGENWDDDPYILAIPSASVAIAWSPDGKYLAAGNMDNTLTVLEWGNPHPWVMQGFPGKVRQLSWSRENTDKGAPLLAAASAEGISVWEKQLEESAGWDASEIELHEGVVQAIAFQPGTFTLASAAEDGHVCLWQQAEQLMQILEGAPDGFSCLAWQPQGQRIAAGGYRGELLVWSIS